MNFLMNKIFWPISCWFHNNIREPLSRRRNKCKKAHYECCVCGLIVAPYFDDKCGKYSSMRWDYGWHKLDGGKRWICHRCADHGFAPRSSFESTFCEWYKDVVEPSRQEVKALIKEKDPKYYAQCDFYDENYK